MAYKSILVGDTLQFTWINSGATVTSSYVALINNSESLVSCAAMTSSGNGHYYRFITFPDSSEFYVVESKAFIGSNPFKKRIFVRTEVQEID